MMLVAALVLLVLAETTTCFRKSVKTYTASKLNRLFSVSKDLYEESRSLSKILREDIIDLNFKELSVFNPEAYQGLIAFEKELANWKVSDVNGEACFSSIHEMRRAFDEKINEIFDYQNNMVDPYLPIKFQALSNAVNQLLEEFCYRVPDIGDLTENELVDLTLMYTVFCNIKESVDRTLWPAFNINYAFHRKKFLKDSLCGFREERLVHDDIAAFNKKLDSLREQALKYQEEEGAREILRRRNMFNEENANKDTATKKVIIDIVCHQSGSLMLADLILAFILLETKSCNEVRFMCQPIPTVSGYILGDDVLAHIRFMTRRDVSDFYAVRHVGDRFRACLDDSRFTIGFLPNKKMSTTDCPYNDLVIVHSNRSIMEELQRDYGLSSEYNILQIINDDATGRRIEFTEKREVENI